MWTEVEGRVIAKEGGEGLCCGLNVLMLLYIYIYLFIYFLPTQYIIIIINHVATQHPDQVAGMLPLCCVDEELSEYV